MRRRAIAILFLLSLLLPSCASQKESRTWSPGESIICPHCGREFRVPEKLGK